MDEASWQLSQTKCPSSQAQLAAEGFDWVAFANWGTLILRTDGTRWTVEQRFTDKILRHAIKTYGLDPARVEAWLSEHGGP